VGVPRIYLGLVAATLVALAIVPPHSNYLQLLITQIGLNALLAISFDICLGFTGMLSLATALYYGIGAYVFAYALQGLGVDVIVALIIAEACVIVVATVTGFLAVRLKGASFLVISLLLVTACHALAQNWKPITGGDDGLVLDPGIFRLFSYQFVPVDRYYFGLALFAIGFYATALLIASPLGRLMRSVKENDFRSEMLGYNPRAIKLVAFVWAGALAGLAGAGYAVAFQHVHTGLLHWTVSVDALLYAFFGGIKTLVGPLLGVTLLLPLEDFMSTWVGYPRLFTGILLVIVVLVHREGLIGLFNALLQRIEALRGSRQTAAK
jgi:branched-chain amino acid transport system permease protein